MEREWKLGVDLFKEDNLLDPITFDELILTVHCNCREINPKTVREELRRILEYKRLDMEELLRINMDTIIKEAKKGRE